MRSTWWSTGSRKLLTELRYRTRGTLRYKNQDLFADAVAAVAFGFFASASVAAPVAGVDVPMNGFAIAQIAG